MLEKTPRRLKRSFETKTPDPAGVGNTSRTPRQSRSTPRANPETNPTVTGFITSCSHDLIEGWVIDRMDLSRRLRVQAVFGGKVIGEAVAGLYRADVHGAGAGDGCYGFQISLAGTGIPPESVAVVAVDAAARRPLALAPGVVIGGAAHFAEPPAAEANAGTINVIFDVSDLIQYFRNARLPTGIQRVQIEIISNLTFARPSDIAVTITCFNRDADFWVALPEPFFRDICRLSLLGGEPEAVEWREALRDLDAHLVRASRLVFPHGAWLLNLGTSWWLQNYFLNVRAAKERYGIRYIPYVHDCIPVMTPEHCTAELTQDFISWIQGAFQHADGFLVNSEATGRDLCTVGRYLGHEIAAPAVVRLDADYRRANAMLRESDAVRRGDGPADAAEIFLRNGIRPGRYVLFVSTIESRKNHLAAFSAWIALIKRHGIASVPHLVCVGNRGWLNDAVYSKLAASAMLRQRVVMLSRIPDTDLETLYANCLFSLYPSAYEGWGLPVTEALSYGKVPLLADGSSLPEAGGEFAEYFELGSERDLVAKLERLMFDAPHREAREARIAAGFRARSWLEIATGLADTLRAWHREAETGARTGKARQAEWVFEAEAGRYHGLTANLATELSPRMCSGERFRQGDGWWWPEPWGCWTKNRPGRIAFRFAIAEPAPLILFIGIKGVQGQASTAEVSVEGVYGRLVVLEAEQEQWLICHLDEAAVASLPRYGDSVVIELVCASNCWTDFATRTNGTDTRVAGLGVRGFMICRETDILARMRFIEALALRDMGAVEAVADARAKHPGADNSESVP